MTSRPSIVALSAMALIVLAGPALAQSIDLSPVQTLLQGIVDAITGPLGIVIGTLTLIGGGPCLALWHPRLPSGALGRGCNRGHRRCTHHRRRHLDHLSKRSGVLGHG